MNSESETPRTDAEMLSSGTSGRDFVPIEFSRQLERELNRSNQKCGELAFEVEDLKDTEQRRQSWNRERKHEAGYHENTSLDIVWAETLVKAKERDQWRKMAEELAAELNSELLNDFGFRCSKALSRFNEMNKG